MNISSLSFSSPFFLAPLAGYTDSAFRRIAHEWGSACGITEMVSAEGLARGSDKTKDLLIRYPGEERLAVQLFAPDADPVRRCLDTLMKHSPQMIDFNCGCPVNKVVKTGAGSALMKSPEKIHEIVSFLKQNTDVPVSVKFRLGWDSGSINYLEFADACVSAGADMLTLHARTRAQGYSGNADWTCIRRLKEKLKDTDVKVFASGDILSAQAACDCLRETGCDGVMFARGAIGNPFIFTQAGKLLQGEVFTVTLEERIATAMRHLEYMCALYGKETGCRDMRKHAIGYVRGLRGASKVKEAISHAASEDDYRRAFDMLET